MYYGLVLLCVVMFGMQFFCNSLYQRYCGSTKFATYFFALVTGVIGIAALLIINRFSFSLTPFTVFVAALAAINSLLFTICSIKALGLINLSLFSVFSMIGGMALPFAAGILFFGEKMTLSKLICFVLIAISMFFTVEKDEKKGNVLYYIGVFIFNGMSGVLAMLFTDPRIPFAKGRDSDYSIMISVFQALFAAVILLYIMAKTRARRQAEGKTDSKVRLNGKVWLSVTACGVICSIANYWLVIALNHIDGSLQYPLVSGGVMIVSTVISFMTAFKPRKKDVIAVIISFAGMLALLLPI